MNNLTSDYLGYMCVNSSNQFNFFISVLNIFNDNTINNKNCEEHRKEVINLIKLHLGVTQFRLLKNYIDYKFAENDEIRVLIKKCD